MAEQREKLGSLIGFVLTGFVHRKLAKPEYGMYSC